MRWSDERYVRVYVRDTGDWVALGWEAQSVLLLALRKADRAGIIETGASHARGLAGLIGMPADIVSRALPLLLEGEGAPLVISGRALVVRNFIEAQEAPASDAQRAREKRARDRDKRLSDVGPITKCDDVVTKRDETVTGRHEPSQTVTDCHSVPSCSVPIRTDPPIVPQGGPAPLQLVADPDGQSFDSQADAIRYVFAHYRKHHPRSYRDPQPTSKEWRHIRDRFREGITAAELCRAIDGYMLDPFSQGQNDRGTKYDGLALITRDEDHVRKGIGFADNPPKPTRSAPAQPGPRPVVWRES